MRNGMRQSGWLSLLLVCFSLSAYAEYGNSAYLQDQANRRAAAAEYQQRYLANQANRRAAAAEYQQRYLADQAEKRMRAGAAQQRQLDSMKPRPSESAGYQYQAPRSSSQAPSTQYREQSREPVWGYLSPEIYGANPDFDNHPEKYPQYRGYYDENGQFHYGSPNVVVLRTSSIEYEVPAGTVRVSIDGEDVEITDGKIEMAFENMRPKDVEKVKISVYVHEDGYEKSSHYDLDVKYNKRYRGKIKFTPEKVRDIFLPALQARHAAKLKDYDSWHEKYSLFIQNRHRQIEEWRDGMLKQLEADPVEVKTTMTDEVKSTVAQVSAPIDKLGQLLAEQRAHLTKHFSDAISLATAARESGKSTTEVEAIWLEHITEGEKGDFQTPSKALLEEQRKAWEEYAFQTHLDRARKIHAYVSQTLSKWLADHAATRAKWRTEAEAKFVVPARSDLEAWEKAERTRVSTIADATERKVSEEALVREKKRREQAIEKIEASIVSEEKTREAYHQKVASVFEAEFRQTLAIKDAFKTQDELSAQERVRMGAGETQIANLAASEAKTAVVEAAISKYRIEKTIRFDNFVSTTFAWEKTALGDRAGEMGTWSAAQTALLDAIPYVAVKARVKPHLEAELKRRKNYEAARRQQIEALALKQIAAVELKTAKMIVEYRETQKDVGDESYRQLLAQLDQGTRDLEAALKDADTVEADVRNGWETVDTYSKKLIASYPLPLRLAEAPGSYFLGLELDDTLGLYFVQESGERKKIASFDKSALVDAVAKDGRLLLVSRGVRNIGAETKLAELSNLDPKQVTSHSESLLLLFEADQLVLTQKPDLENARFTRAWNEDGGGYFVNLSKGEAVFTLKLSAGGDSLDIVDTQEPPKLDRPLFERVGK